MPSDSRVRPRVAHWSVNQAVASRSAGVQPPRRYPPESGSLPIAASAAHIRSNDSGKAVARCDTHRQARPFWVSQSFATAAALSLPTSIRFTSSVRPSVVSFAEM